MASSPAVLAEFAVNCCAIVVRAYDRCMSKAHTVLEIVLLLQGAPVYDFAHQNLAVQGIGASCDARRTMRSGWIVPRLPAGTDVLVRQ